MTPRPQPRVTIGVPVYNAESLLEQCLENLAAQTFADFKVVILDNASTDGTEAIAKRFVAKDARFSYHRQPHNKGARQNFSDVLEMADTPYFMWRADDDRSDVNFLEEMVRLLDANPSAAVAVGKAVRERRGRQRVKRFPRRGPLEPAWLYRVRLLLRSRAGWIYGLFRTDELRASLADVYAGYRHVTALDHLTLFPFLVTLRVVGSNRTAFVTGFVERPGSQKGGFLDPAKMQEVRDDFLRYCLSKLQRHLRAAAWGLPKPVLWLYADKSYRWVKIVNARSRQLLGGKSQTVTSKYD